MKFTGRFEQYFWVEWISRSAFLNDFLNAYPQIVLDKYLVNSSFDSGSLSLTPEELEQGWQKYNELALSPRIKNISDIPGNGYDEWYIFEMPNQFDNYEVFVNYGGFSLYDSDFAEIHKRFWWQLPLIKPTSYLAEGDNLIFVTKDNSLFEQVSIWQEK
jgi:hypothetical protein